MEDPCKSSLQLTRSVTRWAEEWSKPCGNREGREAKFIAKVTSWMENLYGRVYKRAKCAEMEEEADTEEAENEDNGAEEGGDEAPAE